MWAATNGETGLFRIIDGGLASSSVTLPTDIDPVSQVVAEGQRRLKSAGIDRYEARERLTGIEIPIALRHFKLQMEFAVKALSTLSQIPADITADGYWPTFEGATTLR